MPLPVPVEAVPPPRELPAFFPAPYGPPPPAAASAAGPPAAAAGLPQAGALALPAVPPPPLPPPVLPPLQAAPQAGISPALEFGSSQREMQGQSQGQGQGQGTSSFGQQGQGQSQGQQQSLQPQLPGVAESRQAGGSGGLPQSGSVRDDVKSARPQAAGPPEQAAAPAAPEGRQTLPGAREERVGTAEDVPHSASLAAPAMEEGARHSREPGVSATEILISAAGQVQPAPPPAEYKAIPDGGASASVMLPGGAQITSLGGALGAAPGEHLTPLGPAGAAIEGQSLAVPDRIVPDHAVQIGLDRHEEQAGAPGALLAAQAADSAPAPAAGTFPLVAEHAEIPAAGAAVGGPAEGGPEGDDFLSGKEELFLNVEELLGPTEPAGGEDLTLESAVGDAAGDLLQGGDLKGGLELDKSVEWVGEPVGRDGGNVLYARCQVESQIYEVGGCALFTPESAGALPYIARLQSLWEATETGEKLVRVAWCFYPQDLPDVVARPAPPEPDEVYESNHCDNNPVGSIMGHCLILPPSEYAREKHARAAAGEGGGEHLPPLYLGRFLYDAPRGVFTSTSG
eukprot:jgi/Mesen1/4538/ME000231S03788